MFTALNENSNGASETVAVSELELYTPDATAPTSGLTCSAQGKSSLSSSSILLKSDSIFVPGNLKDLSSLRAFHLLYTVAFA